MTTTPAHKASAQGQAIQGKAMTLAAPASTASAAKAGAQAHSLPPGSLLLPAALFWAIWLFFRIRKQRKMGIYTSTFIWFK